MELALIYFRTAHLSIVSNTQCLQPNTGKYFFKLTSNGISESRLNSEVPVSSVEESSSLDCVFVKVSISDYKK